MKTLILCPGSYRSGTTWLHEYLTSYDCVADGMKEPNSWIPNCVDRYPEYVRYERNNNIKPQTLIDDFWTYHNDMVTDISPAYSPVFESEDYERIRYYCESIGVKVKLIFILRDPWTNNMSRLRAREHYTGGRLFPSEFIEAYSIDPAIIGRENLPMSSDERANRYDIIIPEIEKVFEPDDIEYIIFEEMFRWETLENLYYFLGLPPKVEFINKVVNHYPSIPALETDGWMNEAYNRCQIRHQKSYEFCYDRFPKTKQLWARGITG